MEFFSSTLFLKAISNIDRHYELFSETNDENQWAAKNIIVEEDRIKFDKIYGPLEDMCDALELRASTSTLRKMRACLQDPTSTYAKFFALGPEFSGRFKDEMDYRVVFALTLKEASLFQNPRQGWEEICERFPDAMVDIEEAHYCLAFERYAASVFHSLQIIEVGLIGLGSIIGATDHQTGWNATTSQLKKIISTKYSDRTPFQQKNAAFLEQVDAAVEVLKLAWRNKISHAQGKLTLLTSNFQPRVAEEVIFATRAFMRRLSTDAPLPEEQSS